MDWKKRCQILQDVVFFEYVDASLAKEAPYVFVWDLDKTYLDTHFESVRGLYRTIKEKAFQKKNIPGTRTLVKALTVKEDSFFPIYFVTASPPQMEN
jgi:phosphatidate phosphatase APP1